LTCFSQDEEEEKVQNVAEIAQKNKEKKSHFSVFFFVALGVVAAGTLALALALASALEERVVVEGELDCLAELAIECLFPLAQSCIPQ